VRRHAAEALGKIGDPESLNPLIEALADEDWLVRRNAAESLARLKNNRAIDPLVPLLEDENEMVRDTVEGALSSLGWTPSSSK
jgi:HEAT repeat protein